MHIPRLEDLSIPTRIVITIVIVCLAILLVAIVGFATGRWEAEGQEQLPPMTKYEARILDLETKAIDEAFMAHIKRLFDIWVTDYQKGQPPRAVIGARNAREAYVRSMDEIERRRQRLEQQKGRTL